MKVAFKKTDDLEKQNKNQIDAFFEKKGDWIS